MGPLAAVVGVTVSAAYAGLYLIARLLKRGASRSGPSYPEPVTPKVRRVPVERLRRMVAERGGEVGWVADEDLARVVAHVGDVDLAADVLAQKPWPSWLFKLVPAPRGA